MAAPNLEVRWLICFAQAMCFNIVMTISLDLRPETEEVLRRQASLAGIPLPQLLAQLVEEAAEKKAGFCL